MNRRSVALLSLASFLAMAVFGLVTMNHAMEDGSCVASVAEGVACPLTLSTGGFLALHASFYHTLTSAALFIVLVGTVLFARTYTGSLPVLPHDLIRSGATLRIARPRSATRWFALLETSPTTG